MRHKHTSTVLVSFVDDFDVVHQHMRRFCARSTFLFLASYCRTGNGGGGGGEGGGGGGRPRSPGVVDPADGIV